MQQHTSGKLVMKKSQAWFWSGEKNTACHSAPLKVCLSDTPVCQCNLWSEEIVWRCCILLKLDGRSRLEVSTAAFSIPLPPEMGIPLWALNFCFYFFPLQTSVLIYYKRKTNRELGGETLSEIPDCQVGCNLHFPAKRSCFSGIFRRNELVCSGSNRLPLYSSCGKVTNADITWIKSLFFLSAFS